MVRMLVASAVAVSSLLAAVPAGAGSNLRVSVNGAGATGEAVVTQLNEWSRSVNGVWEYRIDVSGTSSGRQILCTIAVASPQEAERIRKELADPKTTAIACTTDAPHTVNTSAQLVTFMNTLAPDPGDVIQISSIP
jgi:methyl coenzyme M reductase gamma subunit